MGDTILIVRQRQQPGGGFGRSRSVNDTPIELGCDGDILLGCLGFACILGTYVRQQLIWISNKLGKYNFLPVFAGIVVLFQDGSNALAFALIGLPLALILLFGSYQLVWKRFLSGECDIANINNHNNNEQQLKFCPLCEDQVPWEEWSRDGHRYSQL